MPRSGSSRVTADCRRSPPRHWTQPSDILLPSICLIEITYLIEKGRLHSATLPRVLAELDHPATTLELAPLDLGVVLALQDISRFDVPDLPDRVIAATAWHHCVPIVTRDVKIRSCGIETIW